MVKKDTPESALEQAVEYELMFRSMMPGDPAAVRLRKERDWWIDYALELEEAEAGSSEPRTPVALNP